MGDDVAAEPGFEADCAEVLRAAARRRPLFLMHGNRDFLIGDALRQRTGATLLADPTVFSFGGARWLISHGDALCLGDTEYQKFRQQVRQPAWQQQILALPLAQRKAMARGLRAESENIKREGGDYADVDTAAALEWLSDADAGVLIHGHTHRPGEHALDAAHRRIVLSDWDAEARPPRLEALRLGVEGSVQRIPLA